MIEGLGKRSPYIIGDGVVDKSFLHVLIGTALRLRAGKGKALVLCIDIVSIKY